jgi:hypothetical protein
MAIPFAEWPEWPDFVQRGPPDGLKHSRRCPVRGARRQSAPNEAVDPSGSVTRLHPGQGPPLSLRSEGCLITWVDARDVVQEIDALGEVIAL